MRTRVLLPVFSALGLASFMACSSSSTTSPGTDGGTATDGAVGPDGASASDGGVGVDASGSDAGMSAADSGPITIGTVTVSGWEQLQANGRIASDNAGTTFAGTESAASISAFAAGSTTAKAGPTGLGFVTLGLSWDGAGNLFAATNHTGKYDVLTVAPGGAMFGPSAFTGDATGGLYRDRGGNVYAWEQSSFAVAGKLSRTTGGSAAFTALPAFPTVVSLNDLSSGPDGTVYAAITDTMSSSNPTVFSLPAGAAAWVGLPTEGMLIASAATSVVADGAGNVYTMGAGGTGGSLKLAKGGAAWTALTAGPTKGIATGFSTNLVADGAGTVFCVDWDGATGFSLYTLTAGSTAWTSTAITGPVYNAGTVPNHYTRLLIDAKNRLVVSIPNGFVYRSTP